METQTSKRNQPPTEGSSLPTITLAVLVLTIAGLLYVGYEYIADDTRGAEELTSVPLDTTVQNPLVLPTEPELVAPMEIDTSSRNAPIDMTGDASAATADEATAPAPVRQDIPGEEDTNPAEAREERVKAEKPKEEKPKEEKPKEEKPREEAPREEKKETPKASAPAGGSSHTHTVRPGETLYSVATRYNLSMNTLKALNPDLKENDVKADITRLKVKVRAVHTVGPGDILRVVAEKYGVTVEALMKANGKTKNFAERGEKLVIPYAEKQ